MTDRGASLIQRAAERLRKQRPAPTEAPEAADNGAAALSADSLALPPAPRRSSADNEPRISREVKIDRQRLARSGITFAATERSRIAEEFRVIIRQLVGKAEATAAAPGGSSRARLIMVTSARPREGKTFASINLALTIASQPDYRVLAVDCDIDHQSMTSLFNIAADRGLIDLLADDAIDMRDVMLRTDIPNLSVLPAGPRRAGVPELLSSRRMRDILTELAERYSDRYIVIDAPPCLATSDPSILASLVGQIVFVVEANRTQEAEIEESIRLVSTCPNISLILNKVEGTASEYFGSYGYY